MTEVVAANVYVVTPRLVTTDPATRGFAPAPPVPDAMHAPGEDGPRHRCEARVYADCGLCGRRVIYCSVSRSEMRRIRSGAYRCPECRSEVRHGR